MAQAANNAKIEELRARLKADPKSRLFYQLAEELRRAGQPAEAEQILRAGIAVYPTYLAAWVSLGRTCRELSNDRGAVEALGRALLLDPGNVVAARLLGDAHLALGDKLEAIKKYKLVHALLPSDEELEGVIERLDRELNAPALALAEMPDEPVEQEQEPAGASHGREGAGSPAPPEESPFDKTQPPFSEAQVAGVPESESHDSGDDEPMFAAHEESPFEEPAAGFTAASAEIEHASGFSIQEAPLPPEPPEPLDLDNSPEESDVFEPASPKEPAAEGVAQTATMADLYAKQGLQDDARHIYEKMLEREPENEEVRHRLESLPEAAAPAASARIDRLERWLARVSRKGAARV